MQQWLPLSNRAMEESLHDIALFREVAELGWDNRMTAESTIPRFRHLLEKRQLSGTFLATVNDLLSGKGLVLRASTVVDTTLMAVPYSTKNSVGERDPEMKQSKKGNQWHFGIKAQIGADDESDRAHRR
jgi:IS5 family transposase